MNAGLSFGTGLVVMGGHEQQIRPTRGGHDAFGRVGAFCAWRQLCGALALFFVGRDKSMACSHLHKAGWSNSLEGGEQWQFYRGAGQVPLSALRSTAG